MGLFKKFFCAAQVAADDEGEKKENRKFQTLRDDGVRAMRMGETKFATQCFEEALEINASDIQTIGFLAEARLRMQNYIEALPLLITLAAEQPDNFEIQLLLTQVQGKTGDYEAMHRSVSGLLASHANDARVPYMAAESAHGKGDDFAAIAFLTQAIALHEDYVEARHLRAEILAEMGQWREVLEDTAVLTKLFPDNDEFWVMHGNALTNIGNIETVEIAYTQAMANNPFNREAVLSLGRLFEQTSRLDKALVLYDEVIEAQPDFAEIYKQRGGVKHRLHDYIGAADDLKRALEINPDLVANFEGLHSYA